MHYYLPVMEFRIRGFWSMLQIMKWQLAIKLVGNTDTSALWPLCTFSNGSTSTSLLGKLFFKGPWSFLKTGTQTMLCLHWLCD